MARELLPTDESGPPRRRYELTPLFWGVATITLLGLLTAAVVLLGVETSHATQLLDGIHGLSDAIKPKGHCAALNEQPWKVYLDNEQFMPGSNRAGGITSALDFVVKTLQPNTYSRRLSEVQNGGLGDLCPFTTEAECNTPNSLPYMGLVSTAFGNNFKDSTCIKIFSSLLALSSEIIHLLCDETEFKRVRLTADPDIPDVFFTLDLCYSTNALNPCSEDQTAQFDKLVKLVKDSYPYPCKWQRETLGSFLSARFPFPYSLYVSN
jgi:hypothetical protein